MNLNDTLFLKARSGVYADTAENRRLKRVGKRYGEEKQQDEQPEPKQAAQPDEDAQRSFSSEEELNEYYEGKINELYEPAKEQEVQLLRDIQQEKKEGGAGLNKMLDSLKAVRREFGEKREALMQQWREAKESFQQPEEKEPVSEEKPEAETTPDTTDPTANMEAITSLKDLNDWYHKSVHEMLDRNSAEARAIHSEIMDAKAAGDEALMEQKRKEKEAKHEEGVAARKKIDDAFKEKYRELIEKNPVSLNYPTDDIRSVKDLQAWYAQSQGRLIKEFGANMIAANLDLMEAYQRAEQEPTPENQKRYEELLKVSGKLDRKLNKDKKALKQAYLEAYESVKMRELEDEVKKEEGLLEEEKPQPKFEPASAEKDGSEEMGSRVKIDGIPNSGKVNMKKYLSKKSIDSIDYQLKDMGLFTTPELTEMVARDKENFNTFFDRMSKAERAKELYRIMKQQSELDRRAIHLADIKRKPFDDNNRELAKAIGVEQGRPMSFEEADGLRGNPFYDLGSEYRMNCQSCVVVNELRRRGFDVQTMPWKPRSNRDQYRLACNEKVAFMKPTTMLDPDVVSVRFTKDNEPFSSQFSMENAIENINAATAEQGRYTLTYAWKQKKQRNHRWHIISMERGADGRLTIFDPQNGKVYGGDLKAALPDCVSMNKTLRVMKIDDLLINPTIAHAICVKRKKVK